MAENIRGKEALRVAVSTKVKQALIDTKFADEGITFGQAVVTNHFVNDVSTQGPKWQSISDSRAQNRSRSPQKEAVSTIERPVSPKTQSIQFDQIDGKISSRLILLQVMPGRSKGSPKVVPNLTRLCTSKSLTDLIPKNRCEACLKTACAHTTPCSGPRRDRSPPVLLRWSKTLRLSTEICICTSLITGLSNSARKRTLA